MAQCALASVVTWAAVFLLPVFVQSVQGRSALVAGLAGRSVAVGLVLVAVAAAGALGALALPPARNTALARS